MHKVRGKMFGKIFAKKLKVASLSVMPITLVVFLLLIFFVKTETNVLLLLAVSAVCLILGISLFLTGVESSMVSLGSDVGSTLSKSKKMWFTLLTSFLIGFLITLAEPDLSVFAGQVANATNLSSTFVLLIVVSLGVGTTFMIGVIKMIFKIPYSRLLAILYSIILLVVILSPEEFVLIAFDSGAVTTGALSVPFLLAFGVGVCAVRGGGKDEGLGLLGMASIGPVISTMFLGLFLNVNTSSASTSSVQGDLFSNMLSGLGTNFKETALVLLPLIAVFVLFQVASFKYPKTKVFRMLIGFSLTYVGISIFLTGAKGGYLPTANIIGKELGSLSSPALSIFIGGLLGALAVVAEPSLLILKRQIEQITNGRVRGWSIFLFIVLGVALAVVMSVLSVVNSFSVVPIIIALYIVGIVLSFINTSLFSSLAFDSGGIATGTMATTFILPLISSLSTSSGFGTVALIAVFPIFTLQMFGLVYRIKLFKAQRLQQNTYERGKCAVVEFDYKRRK